MALERPWPSGAFSLIARNRARVRRSWASMHLGGQSARAQGCSPRNGLQYSDDRSVLRAISVAVARGRRRTSNAAAIPTKVQCCATSTCWSLSGIVADDRSRRPSTLGTSILFNRWMRTTLLTLLQPTPSCFDGTGEIKKKRRCRRDASHRTATPLIGNLSRLGMGNGSNGSGDRAIAARAGLERRPGA